MKNKNNWTEELIPISYQLKEEFEKMNHTPVTFNQCNSPFYDGVKWAVRQCGNCLGTDGEWHYEPMPSSRTTEFYALCRFDSLELAVATYKVSFLDVKEIDKPEEKPIEHWIPFSISALILEGAINSKAQWKSFCKQWEENYWGLETLLTAKRNPDPSYKCPHFDLKQEGDYLGYGQTLGEFFKENNMNGEIEGLEEMQS